MSRRLCALLGVIVIALAASGCATILSSKLDRIDFTSEPPGAEVIVNGRNYGKTPVALRLDPAKDHAVVIRKAGFEDTHLALSSHVQPGWVVLDILGGLVGVAVDAATGMWKAFDEDFYYIRLDPRRIPPN